MAGSNSTKVVVIAFLMNMGIAVAKFIAFFFTGSSAMMAEAVHSLADTSNQVFLFLGIRKSTKRPTALHPFGYGMEQYIWSFLVALLIFALGGIFSIYEGIHKLIEPPKELPHVYVNLIVLGVAILLEGYSSLSATKEFRKISGGKNLFTFVRRTKDQVLVTVMFEDYAALLGLVLAFLGTVMYLITGNTIYDSAASIAIGVLLGVIAVFLYREAKSLLLGEAAHPEDQEKIRSVFSNHPEVTEVKELLTMHLSPTQILINAHLKFRNGMSLEEVEAAIDTMEAEIVAAVPEVYRIFIETHQKEQVEPLQHGKSYDPSSSEGKRSSFSKSKR
jgi:cation diffusion facilitator family transporter